MKKSIIFLFMVFLTQTVISQQAAGYNDRLNQLYKHTVDFIDVNSLDSIVALDKTIYILDTREPEEYKVSHIQSAINVGFNSFKVKSVKDVPKDSIVVVYCSLGVRSEMIGEKLKNAGYKNIYNLYGGIFEWVHKNKKVYNKKGETEKVHTYNEEWSRWLHKGEKVY